MTMSDQLIDIRHPLNVCRASAGTGKTFTLAAYYVGLLLSGESYRSILAVTFTNNATSEMKERIMGYLFQLKEGKNQMFLDKAKTFMIRRTSDSDQTLRERAGECFKQMLLDYDNVHIQTIDSFLLNLQSGLAAVLKMSAGYTPELDTKRVITQAVDQMLTTDLSERAKQLLVNYVKANLEEDDKSDIRKALIGMANDLYNESVQMLEAEGRIPYDAQAIEKYRERLDEAWRVNPERLRLQSLVAQMQEVDPALSNGKALNSAILNLQESLKNPGTMDKDKRFRGLTDTQLESAEGGKWNKLPAETVRLVAEGSRCGRQCLRAYNTYQLSKEFTYDLQLMSELRVLIHRNLLEANKTLLARTADQLCRALKDGDADFILEKAGIRYHHVLLDEFQDTSKLQWQVFNKLLKELAAGEGNSILVVGDIKQSIYRWRNGDWHTMEQLGKENTYYHAYHNEQFPRLVRNFRSSKQVVEFNLSLFRYIGEHYAEFAYYKRSADKETQSPNAAETAQVKEIYDEGFLPEKIDEYYRSNDDAKAGGYVCFRAFVKEGKTGVKPQMLASMFDEMERLLGAGITPEQMMVLVRYNTEVSDITEQFNQLDPALYPLLSRVHLATESSYHLSESADIKAIMAILYCLVNRQTNSVYEEIIHRSLPTCDIDLLPAQFSTDTPLFETVSDILRLYFCDRNGQYTGTEHAYIDTFLDHVRSYVASEGGKVEDFLTYWEETLQEKSIPMSSVNAIRIMTVHKSKGLEAQTLFVPFCNWESEVKSSKEPKVWCTAVLPDENGEEIALPVQYGLDMKQSDYRAEFEEERHNLRVDNLNLLYVALTRARDNLFVFTDCDKKMETTNSVGQYLLRYEGIAAGELKEGDSYAERVYGEIVVPEEKAKEAESPFDFIGAKPSDSQLWSDGRQVRFVQSKEGQLYTEHGEEAYRLSARMEEGTLCHNIFAHIHTLDELEHVLDEFESRGEIKDKEQRETLKSLISSAWEGNETVRGWFTDPWELQLENAIYEDHNEIRPDRVMIDKAQSKAIVLDYKFGKERKEHKEQVRKYMQAQRDLGFQHVEGYLWYAKNEQGKQLKEVKEYE